MGKKKDSKKSEDVIEELSQDSQPEPKKKSSKKSVDSFQSHPKFDKFKGAKK